MLGSAAIPAILLVIGRLDTPESPAWLVGKGRIEEARAVTKKVFGPNAEPNLELANTKTRFGKVFEGGYGKRILFVSIFWTAAIVPLYSLYTFGPAILNELGMGAGKNAIIIFLTSINSLFSSYHPSFKFTI